MIEETAIVVSCIDNQAKLEVQRQSTCSSCNAKNGCGTAVFSKKLGKKVSQITVANTLNLRVGDKVVVGLHENALLTGSMIVYLLPITLMLIFAILGQWLTEQFYGDVTELLVVGFAATGFIVALKLVNHFSNKIKNDNRFQPILIRKVVY